MKYSIEIESPISRLITPDDKKPISAFSDTLKDSNAYPLPDAFNNLALGDRLVRASDLLGTTLAFNQAELGNKGEIRRLRFAQPGIKTDAGPVYFAFNGLQVRFVDTDGSGNPASIAVGFLNAGERFGGMMDTLDTTYEQNAKNSYYEQLISRTATDEITRTSAERIVYDPKQAAYHLPTEQNEWERMLVGSIANSPMSRSVSAPQGIDELLADEIRCQELREWSLTLFSELYKFRHQRNSLARSFINAAA